MKNIIIAALVGAMTLEDVNAARITQQTAQTPAEQAEAISEKAGNKNEEKENKAVIKAQAPAEAAESVKAANQAEALQKQIEARIAAEQKIKIGSTEAKPSAEEKAAALNKKITEEIEARKAQNEELINAAHAASAATAAENEERHRRLFDERTQAVANVEAETAALNAAERAQGQANAASR